MNYHNITHNDMLNGAGLRVVLFVSGCSHYCKNCQNSQTWDPNSGILFDNIAYEEIKEQLKHNYIKGLTLSGGDPLYPENRNEIFQLVTKLKEEFPEKDIWIYTGYVWEEIIKSPTMEKIIRNCDVLVDGMFEEDKLDVNYPYCGSTNQRVIDIQKTLQSLQKQIVLYESK